LFISASPSHFPNPFADVPEERERQNQQENGVVCRRVLRPLRCEEKLRGVHLVWRGGMQHVQIGRRRAFWKLYVWLRSRAFSGAFADAPASPHPATWASLQKLP
jgi:hypothetical protein